MITMGCGCSRKNNEIQEIKAEQANTEPSAPEMKTLPTEQCIHCACKHMDEAYMLFLEYGYSRENARLCRGNLRAIVLHTYKQWPEIASLARECSVGLQNGDDVEAMMKRLCDMIDDNVGLPSTH